MTGNRADTATRALLVTIAGANRAHVGAAITLVVYDENGVAGDLLTVNRMTGFIDKSVSVSKPVSASGLHLNGADAKRHPGSRAAAVRLIAGHLNIASNLQLAAWSQVVGHPSSVGHVTVDGFMQMGGAVCTTGSFNVGTNFAQAGAVTVSGNVATYPLWDDLGHSRLNNRNMTFDAADDVVGVTATRALLASACCSITKQHRLDKHVGLCSQRRHRSNVQGRTVIAQARYKFADSGWCFAFAVESRNNR